ncbi:MAG: M48 family metalloprotease, partial [Silvibacterium sp.]|nr:M48 family metalloprotease [Silvibacterium sp.]
MDRACRERLARIVVLCLAAQALAQTAGPVFPDPGRPSMSRDEQRSLGLQAAAQVYKQMPVLPDSSPETQYIRQLGEKLVATIPPQHSWPFEFHVVAQKEINAFALPGGPMFVNIGTITAADNEAELAGVMAHEMSHVYMQHSAKQAGKEQTTGMLAGLAAAVLGGATGSGMAGQLGQMGIQFGAQSLMLKYSRTDESQADAVGAVILYQAGYNPQALADFFKKLESQGGQPPQFLSDHPNPGNRELAIQKEIREWPPKDFIGDSPAFAKVRHQAMGVKAYNAQEIAQGAKSGQWASLNQKNGATFNPGGAAAHPVSASPTAGAASPHISPVPLQSVLPTRRMVAADIGPVRMNHPDNWQVAMPQQQGQFATIAPQAGISGDGVGYGVLLNGVAPSNGGRMSIDDVTGQIVQSMEKHNGVHPLGNAQAITVSGIQARSVMLQ